MAVEPLDGLRRALDATEPLLAGIRPAQWAAPTPCTEWDVRALVSHLVAGNRLFAAILRADQPPRSVELGDDAAAAYRSSAADLLAAFSRPGVLAETFTVPLGTVPGAVAVHLRTTEALVHGWDLARATGQQADFPDDVAEEELAFSRRSLPGIPPNRTPFRPPQPVREDAPAIERLVALLGRRVAYGA